MTPARRTQRSSRRVFLLECRSYGWLAGWCDDSARCYCKVLSGVVIQPEAGPRLVFDHMGNPDKACQPMREEPNIPDRWVRRVQE